MFLNRFWDWVRDCKVDGFIEPIYIVISFLSGLGLMYTESIYVGVVFFVLWIIIAEWMYIDYAKRTKDPDDLIFAKIGSLIGTFGFVAIPFALLFNLPAIIYFIGVVLSSIEFNKVAFIVLISIIIIIFMVFYFWINMIVGRSLMEKGRRNKRK